MIVDSSALIAILKGEPESDAFTRAIVDATPAKISAGTLLEAALVVDGLRDAVRSRRFDELVRTLGLEVVSTTAEHVAIARSAYHDFGKGSGHSAGLDFGDCFTYALASETGEPLLFKGDDFSHTDLRPVSL